MGDPPFAGATIERIDNDGGYSPDNCRWDTYAAQNRNTSRNRLITLHGETLPLCDWAEKVGIHTNTLVDRIRRGWTVLDTLTRPVLRASKKQT